MITKPTLFILGAGASIPYGFPSGAALREQICTIAQSQAIFPNIQAVANYTGVTYPDLKEFAKCFMLSGASSIDTFLARRTEFADIGKAVIAAILIPLEQTQLFNHGGNTDDWYFRLWNALVTGVSNIEELAQNKISIFTFNYDRSLEKYLHTSIMHTFNASEEDALIALKYFNIHHVYGSLGAFGLTEDSSLSIRRYKPDFDVTELQIAINSIKVIPEARAEDAIFNLAKEAFTNAMHVCFLGFGFDHLNVQRLGFKSISKSINGMHSKMSTLVVTSSCGMTDSELKIAHDALFNINNYYRFPVWEFGVGYKNLETLRNFAWLLI